MKGAKTGGRKKGVRNKDRLGLEERARRLGIDVFETLAHFAAGHWKELGYENECYVMENAQGATKIGYTISPEMRMKASTELMKYIYPQKKAIEMSSGSEGLTVKIVDYTKK